MKDVIVEIWHTYLIDETLYMFSICQYDLFSNFQKYMFWLYLY